MPQTSQMKPGMPANLLAQVRNISVRRGQHVLLDGVTLNISPGELVVVLGPNGGGKSTLARALLGLLRPNGGEVWRRPGLRVGYVPQSIPRDPTLPISTRDFLRLGGGALPATKPELVASLNIAPILDKPFAGLSGGELKRAALARAMLRQAELLVLDEPLAGVDAVSQSGIHQFIRTYQSQTGAGVLIIMHDILSALDIADRLICLDTQIGAEGLPEQIVQAPEFAAMFGDGLTRLAQSAVLGAPATQIPQAIHG